MLSIRSLVLAAVALLAFPFLAQAQPLSKAEIAKRGKAATALLIVAPESSWTAFCISANGLWIANERVLRNPPADGKVQLVLNANLPGQKILTARIVRKDPATGLALLQSEGAASLATLALHDSDALEELATVYVFGFPFVTRPSLDKRDYPAIIISAASVSSLQRKDGKLEAIDIQAALKTGQSGGPVLDENGKVVGVFREISLIDGKISRVIPARIVKAFLETPLVEFNVPVMRREKLTGPVRFEAKVTSVLAEKAPLKVELVVSVAGQEKARTAMKLDMGIYRAEVVPLMPQLRARVRLGGNLLDGSVKDQEFTLNKKTYFLRDVKSIVGGAKPAVTLNDGSIINGLPTELQKLNVLVDEETIAVNLGKVKEVIIVRDTETSGISVSVVVQRGGREVARVDRTLVVIEAPSAIVPSPAGPIQPPLLAEPPVTRTLPGEVTQIAVGAGGRFFALYMSGVGKIAVFDVNEAKVVKYLDAQGAGVKIAAGQNHLLVALPEVGKIQRWSLKTLELELTTAFHFKGRLHTFAMGSASNGPLFWLSSDVKVFRYTVGFIDPTNMKSLAVQQNDQEFYGSWHPQYPPQIRVSANGRVFGSWSPGIFPSGIETVIVEGTTANHYRDHQSGGYVNPGPDGSRVYTGRGPYTSQAKPIGKPREWRVNDADVTLPACHGEWSFSFQPGDSLDNGKVSIHLPNHPQALGTLSQVQVMTTKELTTPRRLNEVGLFVDQRIHMIPAAKCLLTIPPTGDRVHVYRLDPVELLEKSGVDYLAILSQPPSFAVLGEKFTYQIEAKARKGGLKFELVSGPLGMTISPTGSLTWSVPPTFGEGATTSVIVSVRDAAGQERTHSFVLRAVR